MRSALKRDLDANIFPQPVDESDASGDIMVRTGVQRLARPRIVGNDEPELKAAPAAASPTVADEEPTGAADALLGDLRRIVASLEAARAADPVAAEPPLTPAIDVESPAATAAQPGGVAGDGKPIGAVAAAALRAFREAERGHRPATGFGARLLAAEAERIAVERGDAPDDVATTPEFGVSAPVIADPVFAAPIEPAEPYVYGTTAPAPAEADEFHGTADRDVAFIDDVPLAPEPVATAPLPPESETLARGWQALPEDEFAPPRYRAEGAQPRRVGKGFAFDIHAFVDELEREAADAGRDWGAREGDALFAGDRATKRGAAEDVVAVAPVPASLERAPEWDAGEGDPPPPAVEAEFRHREPALPVDLVPHAAPDELDAPPVRRSRRRGDTFTWKRLALLGVIVAVAGVGAVKLQSIAARNDAGSGETVAEAGATDAAVASVAPHEDVVEPVAAAPAPIRNVTPGLSEAPVVPEADARAASEEPAAAPPADVTPSLRPSVAAEDALLSATGPDRTDAATDQTDQSAVPAAAEAPMDAPMDEVAAARQEPEPSAPVEAAPQQPAVAATPAPQPRPVQLAAAAPAARAPAPSGAAPSGSATIRSGVTLRAGADNKAAALGTLKAGQKVDLVACKLWCEIVADGKRGFVFNKFLDTGAAAP